MSFKESWDIGESEGHDEIFRVAMSDVESRLPLIALPDAGQVVCTMQIDLGENFSCTNLFQKLIDHQERVLV